MSYFELGSPENHTIGGLRFFFNELDSGAYKGFLYLGNVVTGGLTPTVEKLDHYTIKSGKRLRDRSIVRQANMQFNLTLDEPNAAAMNLFMFGGGLTQAPVVSNQAVTGHPMVLNSWEPAVIPHQNPGSIVVKKGATTLVQNTDYTITDMYGYKKIKRVSTSVTVQDGDACTVDYTYSQAVRYTFNPATKLVREGKAIIHGVSDVGNEFMYEVAKASLTPNGDFSFNDQDWSQFQFSLEILEDATNSTSPYGQVTHLGTGSNL